MLARAHTFTIDGPEARHVTVEVDVRAGLPAFAIVGLADTAVREARERIQTAVRNAGFEWPARRITANLAPGDLPKAGPGLDLALACAILAATEQVPRTALDGIALLGELGLDGSVRPARGTLAIADAAYRHGLATLGVAPASAREAALVDGLTVAPLSDLTAAGRLLGGAPADPLPPPAADRNGAVEAGPELAEVRGQEEAVRALVVAAAGGHNLLLSGPPGVGKTMLARRLPGILPALQRDEAIELALLESLRTGRVETLRRPRPFRAPHHTIAASPLTGGEAVLAHRGVLFLDELPEFSRAALDALRQPLDDGFVVVPRGPGAALQPTRFMLVCAMNPCPCGYADEPERCRCSGAARVRYRRRLSGPLLDRIDLIVGMHAQPSGSSGRTSTAARAEVCVARERQARRLAAEGIRLNSEMDAAMLARHARLDARARQLLDRARRRGSLSPRAEHRTLVVARTIADLAGRERIRGEDVTDALTLRS